MAWQPATAWLSIWRAKKGNDQKKKKKQARNSGFKSFNCIRNWAMGWFSVPSESKVMKIPFAFILRIAQSKSVFIWDSGTALLQHSQASGAFHQRLSAAVESMFHDTCLKWRSDSGLFGSLCQKVIGHSWRDREGGRGTCTEQSDRNWIYCCNLD